eukprot:g76087.t1
MSEAVVARLEAVVNKLDKSGGGDDSGPPPAVAAYDEFYKASVTPFAEATEKIADLKVLADRTKEAFSFIKTVLEAATVSAKPSDEDFLKFLGPVSKIIGDSSNPNNRSKTYFHEKAFAEIISSLSWVMTPGPAGHISAQLEAADFNLNKVLMAAKDMPDPDKTNHRNYVNTLKKLMTDQAEYCNEWYKQGIMWKHNGAALSAYKPGAAAAKPAAEGKKTVDDRLEALAVRLERLAAKSGGGDDGGEPPAVTAYNEFYKQSVEPLIATCATFPELKAIGEGYEKAYKHQKTVIAASFACKKPSDQDLMKFLDPIVQVITASGNCDNRSKFFNHQKAFNETIQSLSWIMMPGGGKAFVEGQLVASDFYLNKVLTAAKDMEDPAKTNHRNFVKQIKDLMNSLGEYTNEYFKMGLGWNAKGGSVLEFKA